jgi:hypothetical protein
MTVETVKTLICDRCGARSDKGKFNPAVPIPKRARDDGMMLPPLFYLHGQADLCEDCIESMHDWWHEDDETREAMGKMHAAADDERPEDCDVERVESLESILDFVQGTVAKQIQKLLDG